MSATDDPARSGAKAPIAFEVEGLGYEVEGRAILTDVSIAFQPGMISALVGHNGSGKSTLLKLMARQIVASRGQIRIDGCSIGDVGARAFARSVAYLPQDLSTAAGMTVKELVGCGRYPWHGAIGRFTEADRQKVAEAMELTDVVDMADRLIETLSGGERQRAWIAMLIAQDSRCLLLDEPTSALDIAHQVEVLSLIRRLAHEKGLSVVIVLHDINMAARYCDAIYALKRGRLVAAGKPVELMTGGTLEDIYNIRMDVISHPTQSIPLAYVH